MAYLSVGRLCPNSRLLVDVETSTCVADTNVGDGMKMSNQGARQEKSKGKSQQREENHRRELGSTR